VAIGWLWGLVGGALIGCAGAVYLLGHGRMMGGSGILGGLVDGTGRDTSAERLAFLAALIGVPALLFMWGTPVETHATTNWLLLVAGGLLVGLGTRIGDGFTSGQGVCGISRLDIRGIVATCIYIGAGVLSVTALRGLF